MATGRAIKAGEAFIELTLKGARGFGGKLRGALREMGSIAKAAARVSAALATAFGTATIALISRTIQQFVKLGDQIQKLGQRTGFSAEALSELKFAAEQSGTDIDQLGQALFRANRRIANAATETGPAVRALKELGLVASDLSRLSPEEQFIAVVEALEEFDNQGRRSQLAFEIFGDNWRQIAPLLNQGAEGIQNLREQARAMNATMTQEQADRAAELADSWNELRTVYRGLAMDIAAELAPALAQALGVMRDFLLDWKIWVKSLEVAWFEFIDTMVPDFSAQLDRLGEFLSNFTNNPAILMRVAGASNFLSGGAGARSDTARRELQRMMDAGRPSDALRPLFREAESLARQRQQRLFNAVEAADARARTGSGASSIGSFRGESGVFGPRSVQRQALKVAEQSLEALQNIEAEITQNAFPLVF